MSIIKNEVSSLVGAYIRAWFWGALIGALLTLWAMGTQSQDYQLQCPVTTADVIYPSPLPCMDRECLEAFGYTLTAGAE
jgi:hypothetical protein